MKHTTIEDLRWLACIFLALAILAPALLIDHYRQVRMVKRQANARKLSDKYITCTGDITRMRKRRAKA